MAKKSVKLGLRSGSAVESGDVNVTYNGVRIAGLSESTTATLETENTIVEHDIEIEYMKPEAPAGLTFPALSITNNSAVPIKQIDLTAIIINDSGCHYTADIETATNYIPGFFEGAYSFALIIESDNDSYDVVVNDTVIPFEFGAYQIDISNANYSDMPDITISITDK